MKHTTTAALALLALGAAACAPRMKPVQPIVENGARIPSAVDHTVAEAHAEGAAVRADIAEERDATEAAALASCSPAVCDAITRGEVALGMTEEQVLTATRTGRAAWEFRGGARVRTLVPATLADTPDDAVGPLAYVTLENGRVRSYAYREPQGVRLVASAADASAQGTARARAEALLRQGDEMALVGDFTEALDRYDRADVIDPGNPEVTIRIARSLDKLLRPVEAELRYRLFLHQMELERIRVQGEAYAHLAAAIAEARERVIVLERRR